MATHDLTDYIVKLKEHMSIDLCQRILAEYAYTDEWTPSLMNSMYAPEVRNCALINLSDGDVIQKNVAVRTKLDQEIFTVVGTAGVAYQQRHPDAKFNCDTGYHLLRYEVGNFIGRHVDTGATDHRVISCSIQLSPPEDFTGGGWSFFDENPYYMSQGQGDFVMFPSNFCYPHQILPVESGVRYSIITWLNYQGQ